ncbi:hypothetical protein [Photobacterium sp. J15]|uniref:hypothetical protein n=1 Tax=Photobacterium sp. J15 TaxID=265901 RepID=UPI0007E3B3FF|nr:hypothetical protein [Photobacterium sp. J15]
MTKGMIIRKVMSDGWTIEECLDPINGRYNRYYYGRKQAPVVTMSDKISQQYAAYTLIDKDLRSVIFWLEEIERLKPGQIDRVKDPAKMNSIKGLFVAALTFYGKCFTSCEGRKVKLERKHVPEELQETHDNVMKLRHNFAAHSGAENFEEVKVSLVLYPNKKSDATPKLYSELSQPDYIPTQDLNFKELVTELQSYVENKRSHVGDTVLEKVVRPEGKKYWYKRAKKLTKQSR